MSATHVVETFGMPIVDPAHSKSKVDRAAFSLLDVPKDDDVDGIIRWEDAYDTVANWREAHSYPLVKFRGILKRQAALVDDNADIVQRLKRIRSIHAKLQRETGRLSQMQDIAGCRAVVRDLTSVNEIAHCLMKEERRFAHELKDERNYIEAPKDTGYRSRHLVFTFHSDRLPKHSGLQCEMQVRTVAQHVWATAVEVVGFFLAEDLKGGRGDERWLDFFRLLATAIAHSENSPMVPGVTKDQAVVKRQLKVLMKDLNVIEWLAGFHFTTNRISRRRVRNAYWYLLVLDRSKKMVNWETFALDETDAASDRYKKVESEIADDLTKQAVLVAGDNLKGLRRAYPSFFGDSDELVKTLHALDLFD